MLPRSTSHTRCLYTTPGEMDRVQLWRYEAYKTTDAENKRNTPIKNKINRPRADDNVGRTDVSGIPPGPAVPGGMAHLENNNNNNSWLSRYGLLKLNLICMLLKKIYIKFDVMKLSNTL